MKRAYGTADEVDAHLGKLLRSIVADPAELARLQRVDAVVQWRLTDPEATLTVDLRRGGEPRVELGSPEQPPDVVLHMDGDTAHRFWQDELSMTAALAGGQISTEGPVAMILRLVVLLRPAFGRYRAQLAADGAPG